MKPRRIGRFFIEWPLIERSPEVVRQVMAQCIVIRAELLGANHAVEYVAFSDSFDPVEHGSLVPEYHVRFYSEGDVSRVAFRRVINGAGSAMDRAAPKSDLCRFIEAINGVELRPWQRKMLAAIERGETFTELTPTRRLNYAAFQKWQQDFKKREK